VVLAALVLSLPDALPAQVIRGTIVDQASGERIPNVAVDAVRRGVVAASGVSDERGNLLVSLPMPGRYALRLSHPAFTALTTDEVQVGSDTLLVELRMLRTSIPLRPLVVTATVNARLAGFDERMRRAGSGQFLTRADIDSRPGARTTDLLRQMHGVEIIPVPAGAGRRANVIRLRGGTGRCEPTIYLDGISIRQYIEAPLDDILKPDQIAGVEVYTSGEGGPPHVSSPAYASVVSFWTRPVESVERFSWARIIGGAVAVAGLLTLILLTR
jgi:hypothetical protein